MRTLPNIARFPFLTMRPGPLSRGLGLNLGPTRPVLEAPLMLVIRSVLNREAGPANAAPALSRLFADPPNRIHPEQNNEVWHATHRSHLHKTGTIIPDRFDDELGKLPPEIQKKIRSGNFDKISAEDIEVIKIAIMCANIASAPCVGEEETLESNNMLLLLEWLFDQPLSPPHFGNDQSHPD